MDYVTRWLREAFDRLDIFPDDIQEVIIELPDMNDLVVVNIGAKKVFIHYAFSEEWFAPEAYADLDMLEVVRSNEREFLDFKARAERDGKREEVAQLEQAIAEQQQYQREYLALNTQAFKHTL